MAMLYNIAVLLLLVVILATSAQAQPTLPPVRPLGPPTLRKAPPSLPPSLPASQGKATAIRDITTSREQRFIAVLEEQERSESRLRTPAIIERLSERLNLNIHNRFNFGFSFSSSSAVFGNATRTLVGRERGVQFVQVDERVNVNQPPGRGGGRPGARVCVVVCVCVCV
jgi:hypothetical protein